MGCGRSKPEVDASNMIEDRHRLRKKTAAPGATGLEGRSSLKLVSRDPSDRYFSSRNEEESGDDDMRSEYYSPRGEPDLVGTAEEQEDRRWGNRMFTSSFFCSTTSSSSSSPTYLKHLIC
ncbi:unnamed protein product [Spirodela intermedia]|uniref:Uncharacterized protein n=1 Tax=Spirodela intermedia TaxID=51605 RepID=A0A7I8I9B7_SPIIN|nr:unnamed protein product [Spirodela intermedia]CAA6654229.1 unnamed protein product [Spirodela intermedia]